MTIRKHHYHISKETSSSTSDKGKNALTYAEMIELLRIFDSSNPDPDNLKYDSLIEGIFYYMRRRSHTHYYPKQPANYWNDFKHWSVNSPVDQSIWFKNSKQPDPPKISPPSVFSTDDAISTIGMLFFGIPEVGFLAFAGISALGMLKRNIDARSEFSRRMKSKAGWHRSELSKVSQDLKTFISDQNLANKFDSVFARIARLKGLMAEMLTDPEHPTSSLRGFDSKWLQDNKGQTKFDVLNHTDGLGLVWTLLDSGDFSVFIAQDNKLVDRKAELDLTSLPNHPVMQSMLTIDTYCAVMGVVVNALILYGLICLMPDEALDPDWDSKDFGSSESLRKAVNDDSLWDKLPDERLEKTARDCWQTLHRQLNPDSDNQSNWMWRIHKEHGDAAQAYKLIHARLNQIRLVESMLRDDSQADDLWGVLGTYMANEKYSHPNLHRHKYLHKDTTRLYRFLDQTIDPKDESDGFVQPFFRHYETRNSTNSELAYGFGSEQEAIALGSTQMYSINMFYSTIGWLGFVLVNYTNQLRFGIHPQTKLTTYDIACTLWDAWEAVHGVADYIINLREKKPVPDSKS